MAAHILRDDYSVGKFGELISVRLTEGGDEILGTRANVQRLITSLMAQIERDDARPVNVACFGDPAALKATKSTRRTP